MDIQRVTIVTETYTPEVNGVAHTLGKLVQGLRDRGVDVQIIRPRQDADRCSSTHKDIKSVILPGLPIPGYRSLRFGLPLFNRVKKAIEAFKPDALYIATEGPLGLAAIFAAKRLGVRSVISGFHTNFHQYFEHYRLGFMKTLAYAYLRWFHNQTDGTLVPTKKQRAELRRCGFKRVSILSRGVDAQTFAPTFRSMALRKSWGVTDDAPVVLYVGRIAKEKNLDLLLSAYSQKEAQGQPFTLVVVGDGPQRQSIESKFPNVVFCGVKQGRELAEHYASADIFVFPSKTDTFGNVVAEAMASCLAVVSFDYAAASEYLQHDVSALLAPLDDDTRFVQQLSDLLASPEKRETLRMNAYQVSQAIGWDRIVDSFTATLSNPQNTPSNRMSNYGTREIV